MITLGISVLLVGFALNLAIALAGFSLLGSDTAVIFPLAISAVAQRKERPAAVNVAVLA